MRAVCEARPLGTPAFKRGPAFIQVWRLFDETRHKTAKRLTTPTMQPRHLQLMKIFVIAAVYT